jgi:hypothetical protein
VLRNAQRDGNGLFLDATTCSMKLHGDILALKKGTSSVRLHVTSGGEVQFSKVRCQRPSKSFSKKVHTPIKLHKQFPQKVPEHKRFTGKSCQNVLFV